MRVQDLPNVLEKLRPTLREIRKAVTDIEGEISDAQLLKWGRHLLSQPGKDFARQAKLTVLVHFVFDCNQYSKHAK